MIHEYNGVTWKFPKVDVIIKCSNSDMKKMHVKYVFFHCLP